MPSNTHTALSAIITVVLGLALSLVVAAPESSTPSEVAVRARTGSILLTFDSSIGGGKNESELWALMVKLTTERTSELGGAFQVQNLGKHQLRVIFFDHQERDPAKLNRRILGNGLLEFRLLHPTQVFLKSQPTEDSIPKGYEALTMLADEEDGSPVTYFNLVEVVATMTETSMTHAEALASEQGKYLILLHLTPEGRRRFADVTGANVGRHLGIVVDGKLYCAPRIADRIDSDSAEIAGEFDQRAALELANILNDPLRKLPAIMTVDP